MVVRNILGYGEHCLLSNNVFYPTDKTDPLPYNPQFQQPSAKENFENIMGKGENPGSQHFLLLPQCLSTFSKRCPYIQV